MKLGWNPLHKEPVLQLTRKVKRVRKRHGTTISTYCGTHRTTWKPSSPWSGRSMENNQAILWKIWMWIWKMGECSRIPLLKQQFISEEITRRTISGTLGQLFDERKRLICELSEILGPKTPELVVLKIIEFEDTAWRSISLVCERVYQVTIARVYSFSDSLLVWVRWEVTQTQLDEQNEMVFAEQLSQGIESHRWHADGIQVESLLRIHDDRHPRRVSGHSSKVYSVNLSTSTVESSSCPCSRRLCGGENDNTEE